MAKDEDDSAVASPDDPVCGVRGRWCTFLDATEDEGEPVAGDLRGQIGF